MTSIVYEYLYIVTRHSLDTSFGCQKYQDIISPLGAMHVRVLANDEYDHEDDKNRLQLPR